jgi:hypothetical protein
MCFLISSDEVGFESFPMTSFGFYF